MLKKIVSFSILISIILCVTCSCSSSVINESNVSNNSTSINTNIQSSLIEDNTSSTSSNITSTESKSDEKEIVVIPTTSAKDMTSQEVIDLVEKEVILIDLPVDFKFTSGEIEYKYAQFDKNVSGSVTFARQTITFLLFGKLSITQKNELVNKLETASYQNSGFQYKKMELDSWYYCKTIEDNRNATNLQKVTGGLLFTRYISYTTIYKVHTQLTVSISFFEGESNNYNIIIEGQITNENPVEGLLQIQPDGSAKVIN